MLQYCLACSLLYLITVRKILKRVVYSAKHKH